MESCDSFVDEFTVEKTYSICQTMARIARKNNEQMCTWKQMLIKDAKQLEIILEKGISEECMPLINSSNKALNESLSCAIVTIVFSALTLEAYIYEYGVRKYSMAYSKAHLDKLDMLSKCVIITQLVTGTEMDRGGQLYQMIKILQRDRHDIVHNKPKTFDMTQAPALLEFTGELNVNRVFGKDYWGAASNGIKTLDAICNYIKQIDPSEDVENRLGARAGMPKKFKIGDSNK